MKYLEALHWKRRNQGFIGSDDNGFVVSGEIGDSNFALWQATTSMTE